jgi:DNA-binding MarR family transcriptional regulator
VSTGPERWLSDDEQNAWLALSAVMIKLQQLLDVQLQRDAGLSHFEYVTLAMLSESAGRRRRMSELAALTNGSLSRMSHVVKRLERAGWVVRAPDPDDARATVATLTEQGWHKVVASAPGHVDAVRQNVVDPLTATQLRQLRTISLRLLRTMDPDGAARAEGRSVSA